MNFHVMTLFPDMITDGLNTSITGRAIKAGIMSVTAHDIRDYSDDKHLKVDDYPYGGGAGMVMRAGPVCDCYEDIVKCIGSRPSGQDCDRVCVNRRLCPHRRGIAGYGSY